MTSPDELRGLLAGATSLPWIGSFDGLERYRNVCEIVRGADDTIIAYGEMSRDDRMLIVAAVNALPGLLDHIARLEGRVEAGKRFLDKANAAWAAGEPSHRVRDMLDAADAFRDALTTPNSEESR